MALLMMLRPIKKRGHVTAPGFRAAQATGRGGVSAFSAERLLGYNPEQAERALYRRCAGNADGNDGGLGGILAAASIALE
jgi:hypothetical protein